MGKTSIEWTDLSWPLVNGCARKSPGCENCYAEQLTATRLRNMPKYKGLAIYGEHGARWTRESRLWTPDLLMPIRARKHSRIFVADMGDLFWETVTDDVIDRVFATMAICAMRENGPSHLFQLLTKRSDRARAYSNTPIEEIRRRLANAGAPMMEQADAWHDLLRYQMPWPLPNVIYGASVESQKYADERLPDLLLTNAVGRYVSYEPALAGVKFADYLNIGDVHARDGVRGLDWIIVGGESGRKARPFRLNWAASVVEECERYDVACFVKQLGANAFLEGVGLLDDEDPDAIDVVRVRTKHKKGADMSEWPAELRVRQFPEIARAA